VPAIAMDGRGAAKIAAMAKTDTSLLDFINLTRLDALPGSTNSIRL
jgi:hypothetical protein